MGNPPLGGNGGPALTPELILEPISELLSPKGEASEGERASKLAGKFPACGDEEAGGGM